MPDRERYSLEAEMEEAEARARELPDQIARLRDRVRKAKRFLAGERPGSDELGEK